MSQTDQDACPPRLGQDLAARTARQLEQILDHEIDPLFGWWLLDHDAE